jgi:hypothetical protein
MRFGTAIGQPRIRYRVFAGLAALVLGSSWLLEGLGQTKSPATRERHAQPLHLFINGYFPALHGYFFLDGEKLHIYRALPSVLNPTGGNWEPSPEDDELKNLWKGEPYYHEMYELDEGEWVPKMWGSSDTRGKREFTQAPKQYLNFGSCDDRDQIDLSGSAVKRELGSTIRLKDIIESDDYTEAVYSETPNRAARPRRYDPLDRSIAVALLAQRGKRLEFTGDSRSLCSDCKFCGTRSILTKRDGKTRLVLLVFSVSGEYTRLDSYVLDYSADSNFLHKYRQWPESKKP